MFEIEYKRFGLLRSKLAYFATQLPLTDHYHFVSCANCYQELEYFAPFEQKMGHTLLIDLTKEENKLMEEIHKKRRNIIRRGLKINFQFSTQTLSEEILFEFFKLYNKYVAPKGASKLTNFTRPFLKALGNNLTVCVGRYNNTNLVIMMVINDGQTARSLYIARNEAVVDEKESYYIGSALQWHIFMYFKSLGYKQYDMGGILIDSNDPAYGITQYKLSYGGKVHQTFSYEAAISSLAKILLKIKGNVKKIINKV